MSGETDKWVESWELQQNLEIRGREERFNFLVGLAGHFSGANANILDLACGPGSLGGRYTKRFNGATSVGVDYDPVLLHLARNYTGYDHERMSFLEANLSEPAWTQVVSPRTFDAVLSTTALHWLDEQSLGKLFSEIYQVLGKRGIFLNGDHLYPAKENEMIRSLFNDVRHKHQEFMKGNGKGVTWQKWWEGIGKVEEIKPLMEERKRRYPEADNHNHLVSLDQHIKFLLDAGFSAVEVGWQDLDNKVIVAIK